ncbi:phosphatase PAP2 family protein [Pengzhenrongella phosphoraccumulans]|uniref:phosphatase PAP2 family protein n=1 Tax=Pengzhenrongella phosphoraccumulans TaxID=3114394 RepID=UPI00388DE7DB
MAAALIVAPRSIRPPRRQSAVIGAGLGFAGLALFAVLLDGVRERSDLSEWDSPALNWLLAHRTGTLTAVFARISWLADPPVLATVVAVIVIVLVWRTRLVRPSLLLGGAMVLAVATSTTIKVLVARPRPPVSQMISPPELNFAFPSGHTLGAAVFLLVGAYLCWTWRPTLPVALVGLVVSGFGTVAVATSRLYLGYHWFTDVTASMTLAVAILGIVILIDPLLPERARKPLFGPPTPRPVADNDAPSDPLTTSP